MVLYQEVAKMGIVLDLFPAGERAGQILKRKEKIVPREGMLRQLE